ncbi:MAG: peptidase modulator of gyrase [Acidobacteriales bacterium]|nr:peptidase modulator of gyrase [Terriglobales bacterium]
MLTPDQTQSIFDRLKKFSSAGEVELIITGGRFALTRFANNTIHQNVAEETAVVSVRTQIDGKTARATTNKTDDDSLRRAIQSAEQLTQVQEPDPDLLPMAKPSELPARQTNAPSRHFDSTARITPQERAAGVGKIVDIAKKNNIVTAGIFSTSESFEAIVNSKGVNAFHKQTLAEISITMLADDSSGWQKFNSPDVANLRPELLADIAARKTRESTKPPQELAPGKYTVILEPSAALDLVGFMFYDFGAQAMLDERSFLNKRMQTQLFGSNITIHEDAYHPLQSGAQFDGEGIPRQRVALVEGGVPKNLVYSRGNATRMKSSELATGVGNIAPTGHGFPLPNEMGDAPMNIVFSAPANSTKTLDEMISSTERGVLVTRCWYIREVEPYDKILTGMTRDGTFLVENGKVKAGIRNFRFNQSLVEMLRNVEFMGTPVRASGEEAFDMVVPAMKVRDFNFTEVTKF